MKISDNPILIISNKQDITTDLIVKKLHQKELSFIRFNTEEFPFDTRIKMEISGNQSRVVIASKRWTASSDEIRSIWYRRPKLADFSNLELSNEDKLFVYRETKTFLENLWSVLPKTKWVNSPEALAKAENKALQLEAAASCGLRIPHTLFTNDYTAFTEFRYKFSNRLVVKPISGGVYGETDEMAIFANDLSSDRSVVEPKTIEVAPLILQEKIEPKTDVRLTVFGDAYFAYRILPNNKFVQHLDWRRNDPRELTYERVAPPLGIVNSVRKFMSHFDIKFGAFDFSVDRNGEWFFLEINPNGQFGWLEIATGDKLTDALIKLLIADHEN